MIFKTKKAQGWGIDLAVAMSIFVMSITILYFFSINYSKDSQNEFDILSDDAELIIEDILSEGYPKNWNNTNVIKIGILTNGKINNTKIERFYNLTQTNYQKTKSLFNTNYDYFFAFNENISFGSEEVRGIGKDGTDIENIDSENIIRVERYTIYKNKPAKVYLYLWSN